MAGGIVSSAAGPTVDFLFPFSLFHFFVTAATVPSPVALVPVPAVVPSQDAKQKYTPDWENMYESLE